MSIQDLENRFSHHPPLTDDRAQAHANIRDLCLALAKRLDVLLPDGREKSLAVTRLEEVMFWSNAAVARQSGAGGSQ